MAAFDDIELEEVETFAERPGALSDGFDGELEVYVVKDRTGENTTREYGDAVITEFIVRSTNKPTEHPIGSAATWFLGLEGVGKTGKDKKRRAAGDFVQFVMAVCGLESKEGINDIVKAAMGEENVLGGERVHCAVTMKEIKNSENKFRKLSFSKSKGA